VWSSKPTLARSSAVATLAVFAWWSGLCPHFVFELGSAEAWSSTVVTCHPPQREPRRERDSIRGQPPGPRGGSLDVTGEMQRGAAVVVSCFDARLAFDERCHKPQDSEPPKLVSNFVLTHIALVSNRHGKQPPTSLPPRCVFPLIFIFRGQASVDGTLIVVTEGDFIKLTHGLVITHKAMTRTPGDRPGHTNGVSTIPSTVQRPIRRGKDEHFSKRHMR